MHPCRTLEQVDVTSLSYKQPFDPDKSHFCALLTVSCLVSKLLLIHWYYTSDNVPCMRDLKQLDWVSTLELPNVFPSLFWKATWTVIITRCSQSLEMMAFCSIWTMQEGKEAHKLPLGPKGARAGAVGRNSPSWVSGTRLKKLLCESWDINSVEPLLENMCPGRVLN